MPTPTKKLVTWRVFPSTWVSLLLAVMLFPAGLFLPGWWGWENGPIENTQVVILIAGAILSWLVARQNYDDRQFRNLWLWSILVWLLMAGRELSWGRVFFDPVSTGPEGPMFPSIRAVWYGQYVYPILTVVFIVTLIGLWRNFNWANMKQRLSIPAIDGILLIVAAIASQLIFERNLILVLHPYSQVLEEWSELMVYWCMISMAFVIGFKKEDLS
ncbi:hypothetical protein [Pelosinus propionicus]|uniref:Uncharacterized protein n=1 Tax=Pelosinus propionicus DSM 13327 TaxID=1123291 RepID=A0A1I4HMX1_9FIRM|nr:hypothetical protein [Pelosinus propionicus]SFL43628.1 hypothetical protein SAMN04490355_1004126 [Pelosinus propionicus DSM 13327]